MKPLETLCSILKYFLIILGTIFLILLIVLGKFIFKFTKPKFNPKPLNSDRVLNKRLNKR